MEDTNIKSYTPGRHFYQVKQQMEKLHANIVSLRRRGICFYMDESVLLASASKSEDSMMLTPSFYPSDNGLLSLYLIPIVNEDSKIGFVDQKCNMVVEPLYDEIKGVFLCKDNIIAARQDDIWKVIDSNGKELLSDKHQIVPSKDSRMITINSKAIMNVDDPNSHQYIKGGKELLYVGGFRYGFARIHKNNLWGIINEKGEEVLPANYKEMYSFYNYPYPTTKVRKGENDIEELINLNELKRK